MSVSPRKLLLSVLLATAAISTLALVVARSASDRKTPPSPEISRPTFLPAQGKSTTKGPGHRNLSMQPQAFNLARRLGQRFAEATREKSETMGTVTIGSERRTVSTARQQTDGGERIEITIGGSAGKLTWDAGGGAKSSGAPANGNERELMERLVLDSPDEFVLAQLRGASYYTVANNVRPDDAGKDYSGPTWTVVRVVDPDRDETKRPRSRWRLYYINSRTGLIDRIVSESQGQKTIAELNWTESNGETVPAQITWTRQGQVLMRYELSNFSHADQKGGAR